MSRRGINRVGCHVGLSFLLLSVLIACSEPPSDEKLIASALEQLQQAAEKKQLRSVMRYFTDDFLGHQQMNKAGLQGYFYVHFRHNPRVTVYVSNVDIQLDEHQAWVSCHLLVTGSQHVMPDKGRLYLVTSSWRKDRGEWHVFRAEWEDAIEHLVR